MEIVFIVLAVLCILLGVVGCVVPLLPGPPISFVGLLLMRWSGVSDFSNRFLVIWAVVTLVVTVMDYWLPTWFTQKFGGSRSSTIGSVVGLIAGLFFLPPVGIILGPFLGAFIGELLHNRDQPGRAVKVTTGSFVAFIVGTGAKLAASGLMAYYVVKAIVT